MINRFYALTLLGVLGLAALAQGQTFNTLYRFCSVSDCTDGYLPFAGVVQGFRIQPAICMAPPATQAATQVTAWFTKSRPEPKPCCTSLPALRRTVNIR